MESNEVQCAQREKGVPIDVPEGFKSGQLVIDSLKEDTNYRFLRAPGWLLQEERLALQCTTTTYLKRLSVIWSSPLSDANRVFKRPIICPYVVPTLVSDRLVRHRQAGTEDCV